MRPRQPPKSPFMMEDSLDRISNLPGHIIDQILSFLSIRDAVSTSILSNKWRYRWANLSHLIFDKDFYSFSPDDQEIAKSKLVHIVDHVLLLHTGTIHTFKLSHTELQAIPDINRWILHISRSSIKEFVLEIWKGDRYRVPSCLFSCKDLNHLELFNCLLCPPTCFRGFRNLTSLDLQHVTMTQGDFENLICSCPLLERLTLMNFDGVNHLKICGTYLQFFDVGGVFEDVTFENTYSLSVISIGLYSNVHTHGIHSTSSNLLRFFTHLPRIQKLEVQSYFIKYLALGNVPERLPVPCVNLNYLSIRMNFCNLKECKVVLCLLKSSPNLSELEILAFPGQELVGTRASYWVENHSLDQLRVVRIVDAIGLRPELNFMKFVLANSPMLEKLMVKPCSVEGGLHMLKELVRYRRASTQAEVMYLDPQ